MLDDKIPVLTIKQSGFSLVELMISIAVGLLITAAVTAMAVNSLKMNSNTLKSARFNQDMGAVIQIMVNDIRRAGYAGDAGPFSTDEDINIVSSSCVLYSYNRNDDSTIDDNERNGFKLDNGIMKIRTSCTGTECSTDCSLDTDTWVDLTDPDVISINSLAFNTDSSKCHNIDEDKSIRITPGVSATEFACNELDHDNLQQGIVDGEGDWVWGALTQDLNRSMDASLKEYGLGNPDAVFPITSVGVRHVNILLEAELTRDSTVSKNLDVSIKVKNDRGYQVSP